MAERMKPERLATLRPLAAAARDHTDEKAFIALITTLSYGDVADMLDEIDRLNGLLDDADSTLAVVRRERDEARETITRLNRRTQEAEAALADLRKCVEAVNGGKPWCGGSLGRAFLAWDNAKKADRIAELERERDEALSHGDKLASRNRTLAEHLEKRQQGIDGLCMGIARLVCRNAALVKAVEGPLQTIAMACVELGGMDGLNAHARRVIQEISDTARAALARAEAAVKETT